MASFARKAILAGAQVVVPAPARARRILTGLPQDLARRDARAIVRGRNVYQVRGVHVCVVAKLGRHPALRVAEEYLHHVGTVGLRCGEWIQGADMRADEHATSLEGRLLMASRRKSPRHAVRAWAFASVQPTESGC